MARRFTLTEVWEDEDFCNLELKFKVFWDSYIPKKCNQGGIWKIGFKIASALIGEEITEEEVLQHFGDRIVQLDAKHWFIPEYLDDQYGDKPLNPKNNLHLSAIRCLKKQGLWKDGQGLSMPSGSLTEALDMAFEGLTGGGPRAILKLKETLRLELKEELREELKKEDPGSNLADIDPMSAVIELWNHIFLEEIQDELLYSAPHDGLSAHEDAFKNTHGHLETLDEWERYFTLAQKSDWLMRKIKGKTSPWAITWAVVYKNYQRVNAGEFPPSNGNEGDFDEKKAGSDLLKYLEENHESS